jgi:hypothetical protein
MRSVRAVQRRRKSTLFEVHPQRPTVAPPKRLRIRVQRSRPKQKHLHEPSALARCRLEIRGRSLNIFQRWMDGFLRPCRRASVYGVLFQSSRVGMAGWKREKSKSDRDNFAACTSQMLQAFPADQPDSRLRRHQRVILTFETSNRRDSRRHRTI